MQNQEILNQEQHQQELPTITTIFNSIYNGKSKEISYGDAYQSVYKLCKKGMAEDILKELTTASVSKFNAIFQSLDQQQNLTSNLISTLKEVKESIEKILEVLLYIQTNYFQGTKRQHKSIQDFLNSLLFQALCSNSSIIKRISNQIVQLRINGKNDQIINIVQLINDLDEKEIFFVDYLSPIYTQQMSKHYRTLAAQNYDKMDLKTFLINTKETLQNERKWLNDLFLRNKGKKTVSDVMKTLYEATVAEQKQIIYLEKEDELFCSNTQQFLDLLNEKKDESELNKHNQWFINKIKNHLGKIDKTENTKFLTQFIQYYEKIGQSLTNTKTYNIRYKVIFYFEQWINDQRINLPKRLNIYVEKAIVKRIDTHECQKNFKVLFKLLKEKDYFEKQFRRAISLRMIYQEYDENLESTLIKLMEQECGDTWVQRANKMRDAKQQSQKVSTQLENHKVKFSPIVFEDTVWIMERGKLHGQIPKALSQIGDRFVKEYEVAFKGRKVNWHPLHGVVVLMISFNKCKKQFRMETGMASILLYLQQYNNKMRLADFYGNTQYQKEEIKEAISLLQKQKIVLVDKQITQNSAVMTLNVDYVGKTEEVMDFTTRITETILDHNEHEELKADRKMMVEALIVKIMKQSKVITLPKMYDTIEPQIQSRGFQFNESFVHNSFKSLINKNYIRDLEDGSFSYIAS